MRVEYTTKIEDTQIVIVFEWALVFSHQKSNHAALVDVGKERISAFLLRYPEEK